jgi:NADH-quinone oxidoreductase subunit M
MISHGLTAAMMFALVGAIYDRFHTRRIPELTGVLVKLPVLASLLAFGSLAAMGLPSLSGFIGEFMVVLGVTKSPNINPAMIIFVLLGLGITAGYILSALKTIVFDKAAMVPKAKDVSVIEIAAFSPLVVTIIALGIYPPLVLNIVNNAIKTLL